MSLPSVVNLEDLRALARRRLPRIAFDFIDGGADDEHCLRRNREAFQRYRLVPRYLRDVSRRDTSVELLGRRYSSPIGICPTGMAALFRPDADTMLAAAARDADVPFMLSSATNGALEDVARIAPGHVWFQMYCTTDSSINADLVQRAVRAKVGVLVVSVDVPVNSNRERNRRNGFSRPLRLSAGVALEALGHPRWVLRYLRSGGVPMMRNWLPYAPPGATAAQVADLYGTLTPAPGIDWRALARIRAAWPGPLVIKGLLHPDDAREAVRVGAQGVIVSNHGGRQLDAAPSPLEMLPAVRDAVGHDVELMLDSGIRRGSDLVVARCLGARAAFFGRPTLFGVAAAGQAGAAHALAIVRRELDAVLAQIGCDAFESLHPGYLWASAPALRPCGTEVGDDGASDGA